MRTHIARAAYLVFLLVVSGTAWLLIRDHEESEAFQRARRALFEGEYEAAERSFAALESGWFRSADASVGRILSAALQGGEPPRSSLSVEAVEQGALSVELLLSRAFRERNFSGCLNLARVVPGHPSRLLFETAALVELGHWQAARERWDGVDLAVRQEHWLGSRLLEVFSFPPTAGLIRDRKGKLLAWSDAGEGIHPSGTPEPQLMKVLQRLPSGKSPGSVRVSLDADLMEVSERALEGYRGTIALLEPSSGDILAAVSDPATALESAIPAFEQRREPASIAKLITTSAALRTGLDPDHFLFEAECDGAKRYQGGILYCAYRAGPLRGLDRSMAISCNIGFADLAVEIGRDRVIDEFRRFGFDQGGFFGHVREPAGNQRQLADLAIGLEATDITPLHAALLAAIVANQGKLPVPRLIAAEDGRTGFSPRFEAHAPPEPVLVASHNEVLKKSMLAVMTDGTGTEIAVPGFPVAMKTGTGRDPGMGGYHINYIGFGPVEQPTIAFAVRVTHQRNSPRARRAGVEVTRRLLEGLAELQRVGGWPYPPADSPTQGFLAEFQASR